MAQETLLALLRIVQPDGRSEIVFLNKPTTRLGRIPANDVMLSDARVSSHHARIVVEADRISLFDDTSTNGTFVGDNRLAPNVAFVLAYNQEFKIGPFRLSLEPLPRAGQEPRAEAAAPAPPPAPEPVPLRAEDLPVAPPPPAPPPAPPSDYEYLHNGALFGLAPEGSRYIQYLPPLYHDLDLLKRFLLAFEGVLAPIEQTIDNFDLYLDPQTTPAFFLAQLAEWLGVTLDENWTLEQRRTLVAEADYLHRWRGTRKGLIRHLKIYTGATAEIVEPPDRPFYFEVILRLPRGSRLERAKIERIIQANQPAHTSYTLKLVAAE